MGKVVYQFQFIHTSMSFHYLYQADENIYLPTKTFPMHHFKNEIMQLLFLSKIHQQNFENAFRRMIVQQIRLQIDQILNRALFYFNILWFYNLAPSQKTLQYDNEAINQCLNQPFNAQITKAMQIIYFFQFTTLAEIYYLCKEQLTFRFIQHYQYIIKQMPHYPSEIQYSEKYNDDNYEYRHVILPKEIYNKIKTKGRLLTETEWRGLGVQQSRGWIHYQIHKPQPHILLFRRPLGTDLQTGLPPSGFNYPNDEYW